MKKIEKQNEIYTHYYTFSSPLGCLYYCKPAAKPRATIVDYIPAKEILPLPVSVESIDDKPTEYIVKTSLYYNGYDNYSMLRYLYIIMFPV